MTSLSLNKPHPNIVRRVVVEVKTKRSGTLGDLGLVEVCKLTGPKIMIHGFSFYTTKTTSIGTLLTSFLKIIWMEFFDTN